MLGLEACAKYFFKLKKENDHYLLYQNLGDEATQQACGSENR